MIDEIELHYILITIMCTVRRQVISSCNNSLITEATLVFRIRASLPGYKDTIGDNLMVPGSPLLALSGTDNFDPIKDHSFCQLLMGKTCGYS